MGHWARLARRGGTTEATDIEAENAATGEIAFVQVKRSATQSTLDDYVRRFTEREELYQRMIFAVHSPTPNLSEPTDRRIQIWGRKKIADLAVRLGLADWIAKRF